MIIEEGDIFSLGDCALLQDNIVIGGQALTTNEYKKLRKMFPDFEDFDGIIFVKGK